jgi:hypothetical protein
LPRTLIDGNDLAFGSLRFPEAVEERPSAVGRNDNRVRVGPGLDAKPLPTCASTNALSASFRASSCESLGSVTIRSRERELTAGGRPERNALGGDAS